jgi:hypothetical protein
VSRKKPLGLRRVQRVAVVEPLPSVDYHDQFEGQIPGADARTAEQWLRTALEDTPRPLRWCLMLGWRRVLGLHLEHLSSPDYILGWQITAREPKAVRVEAHSGFLHAQLIVQLVNSTVVWNTLVSYTNPMARPLWAVVGLIHRSMVPYLLRRAMLPPPLTIRAKHGT